MQECTTKKEEIGDVIPPPSSLCAPGTTWGRVQEVQKGRSMVTAGKGQSLLIMLTVACMLASLPVSPLQFLHPLHWSGETGNEASMHLLP